MQTSTKALIRRGPLLAAFVIAGAWPAAVLSAHGQGANSMLECPKELLPPRMIEMADTSTDCIRTWNVRMNLDADWSQPRGASDVRLFIDFDGAIYEIPQKPGGAVVEPLDLSAALATIKKTRPNAVLWLEWHSLTLRPALADAVAKMNAAGYTPNARKFDKPPTAQ